MPLGHCTNSQCTAGDTGFCHLNKDQPADCPNWEPTIGSKATATKKPASKTVSGKQSSPVESSGVEWNGHSFGLPQLELVSRRANPLLIATVGEVYAGKSSFLGMLHTLLLRGYELANYTFAGSLTLTGWEALASALRFQRGEATDQAPTPSEPGYYSILHWALRHTNGQLRDILFPDASGEVFSQWAANRTDSNAENVRWIHQNADAFLLFINCQALVEKRGAASNSLLNLASQLTHELNGRPVLVAWSKADYLEQVRPTVKESLETRLIDILGPLNSFEISKELFDLPEPRQLANLRLVDAALSAVEAYRPLKPVIALDPHTTDHFLLYRGK